MKVLNVLVFPGGTEIGLEIRSALCQCKEVRLFSAGAAVSNHAPYVYARHFSVPDVADPHWVDRLNEIIISNHIDYIFPAHDEVLVALAENVDRVRAKMVSSPPETCLISRSKKDTYRILGEVLPVPEVYEHADQAKRYPVFLKPDRGQGSQGTSLIRDGEELEMALRRDRDRLILEYLPGKEYTIDCFSSRQGGLLFCGARERVRTRSGISMAGRPAQDGLFLDYARAIARRLSFHGAWFFQTKQDRNGAHKLLEFAPRIAGTMAFHRVQGVNFPLLSLCEQEGIPIEIRPNLLHIEMDRALVNRYRHSVSFSSVYVDLDDTLILNGKVNVDLIRFLYQCINEGKRLVLLTRHAARVQETLNAYRVEHLFDEVIHLDSTEPKAAHIRERDAIFIDDSFSERKKVSEEIGILTFDCSMIEMLLNERV